MEKSFSLLLRTLQSTESMYFTPHICNSERVEIPTYGIIKRHRQLCNVPNMSEVFFQVSDHLVVEMKTETDTSSRW